MPADRPDSLAGAVLQSLARADGAEMHWSAVRMLALGVLSFGLLPLLVLPRRFRDFVAAEQQQLWHLAEWLRLRSGNPQAVALRDYADRRMHDHPSLWYLSLIAVAMIIGCLGAEMWRMQGSLDTLLDLTYRYPRIVRPPLLMTNLFAIWTIGLSIAYLLHWTHVQWHAADVQRFVDQFNRVAQSEGISPIRLPSPGLGLRPVWMLGCLPLVTFSILWGAPMMLAGAVHQRYVLHVSPALRAELGHRVRALLLVQRPAMNVPRPLRLRMNCPSELCRSAVPEVASFCPRCGTAIKEGMLSHV